MKKSRPVGGSFSLQICYEFLHVAPVSHEVVNFVLSQTTFRMSCRLAGLLDDTFDDDGHANELGETACVHFFHHMSTMHFDRFM